MECFFFIDRELLGLVEGSVLCGTELLDPVFCLRASDTGLSSADAKQV